MCQGLFALNISLYIKKHNEIKSILFTGGVSKVLFMGMSLDK